MRLGLSYDDVLLVPQLGTVEKRRDVDLRSALANPDLSVAVPIIAAPMSSVTEGAMARAMHDAGGFAFIHRFSGIEQQIWEFAQNAPDGSVDENLYAGCALGINEGYKRLTSLMRSTSCRVFCLDVAHAHHVTVGKWIEGIPRWVRDSIYLVVGNVATSFGGSFLEGLGVDAIKVGVGPGAVCSTRQVTGFGVPQFTAIQEVHNGVSDTPIIADGGIKNSGDIAKAIVAGADTVMIGSLFAGADESPNPGEYFGMASKRVNNHHAPEGVEGTVPLTGPVSDMIKQLSWGLKSAVSYAGGEVIEDLKYVRYMQVAPGVAAESGVRV